MADEDITKMLENQETTKIVIEIDKKIEENKDEEYTSPTLKILQEKLESHENAKRFSEQMRSKLENLYKNFPSFVADEENNVISYIRDIARNLDASLIDIKGAIESMKILKTPGGPELLDGALKGAKKLTPRYEKNIKGGIAKIIKSLDTPFEDLKADVANCKNLEDVIAKDYGEVKAEVELFDKIKADADVFSFFEKNFNKRNEVLNAWKFKASEIRYINEGFNGYNEDLFTEQDKLYLKTIYFEHKRKFLDEILKITKEDLDINKEKIKNPPEDLFDLTDEINMLLEAQEEIAKDWLNEEFIETFGANPAEKVDELNKIYKKNRERAYLFAPKFLDLEIKINDPKTIKARLMARYVQVKYLLQTGKSVDDALSGAINGFTKADYVGMIEAYDRLGYAPEAYRYSNEYLEKFKEGNILGKSQYRKRVEEIKESNFKKLRDLLQKSDKANQAKILEKIALPDLANFVKS